MQPDIREQYDKIYRYCYFRLGDVHVAEDITQETFLRSLENGGWKAAGHALAYLYTVARNLCIDEYRKRGTRGSVEELMPGKEPEDSDTEERRVDNLLLWAAVKELPKWEQELVLLRYINEVPVAELAKFDGVSRFALYRKLKQILKKLERRISDETD